MESFLLAVLFIGLSFGQEILQNPGFEAPFDGNGWFCNQCDLTQDSDAYSGTYSVKVSNRAIYWSSISQFTTLQPNTYYYFSAYIKLAEMLAGAMWHEVNIMLKLDIEGESPEYKWISKIPHLSLDQGWQKMAGDFYIDDRPITSSRLYIQVNVYQENPVEYLIDEASLTAFYPNPNWKTEANARIDQIRKNDVTLNVNLIGDYDPANIEVKVRQTKKSYAFGSAIVDDQIAGDTDYNQRYQNTFYTHFNWAVHENKMKWYGMEYYRNQITYPDESTNRLQEKGIPLRGHCVFWDVEKMVPNWLKQLTADEVRQEIVERLNYTVPRYSDKVVHWDVNNEQEHGTWYEEKLGDPNIMKYFFEETRARDSDAVLFLNDYQIISDGGYTQALINTAKNLNSSTNGLVGGIGAQSHFTGGYPDVTRIQKRIDMLAETGFPIWITELDIELEDRDQRANAYDDITTLLYSSPAIGGILLWGFSDLHHWRPNCALFEGDQFQPNAAGLRWQELMFTRWSTSETFHPQSINETFNFRGFHGSYEVQVTENGEEILTQEFELPAGEDISVDVNVFSKCNLLLMRLVDAIFGEIYN